MSEVPVLHATRRETVPAAEDLLGRKFDCLDHGYVRLVDYMGSDAAIVQAARVSYGAGTKSVREDQGLIRYLMRHAHTTPFEMVRFKFHVKLPIFLARQWMRHRTGSFNEYSGRYSVMLDEFYVPDPSWITTQSQANKQGGSDETVEFSNNRADDFAREQAEARKNYEQRLDLDMRRELARINLPVANYTEFYWLTDLHNLMHFLRLRIDPHAQREIRVYADALAEMVRAVSPIAWQAFVDFRLNAVTFSGPELEALSAQVALIRSTEDERIPMRVIAEDPWVEGYVENKSERAEYRAKLARIFGDKG
jgi:thymidylate synthase (FAD)